VEIGQWEGERGMEGTDGVSGELLEVLEPCARGVGKGSDISLDSDPHRLGISDCTTAHQYRSDPGEKDILASRKASNSATIASGSSFKRATKAGRKSQRLSKFIVILVLYPRQRRRQEGRGERDEPVGTANELAVTAVGDL
jgi:hypothetical protein